MLLLWCRIDGAPCTLVLVGPRAAATAAHARALAAPLVKATVRGAAAGVTGGSRRAGGGGGDSDWLLVSTSALLSPPSSSRGGAAAAAAAGGAPGRDGGTAAGGNWAAGEASAAAAAAAAGAGLIMRVAGPDTDAVYALLREALSPLSAELGAPPFGERGLS